jgi:hypothetical protein
MLSVRCVTVVGMTNSVPVRGVELRYLLTTYIFDNGPSTVEELVDSLTQQGFDIGDRPSKKVSDALRWEQGRGRVFRSGRGRYVQGLMPRSTEYRIDQRVLALRAKVAELSRQAGQAACLPRGRLV